MTANQTNIHFESRGIEFVVKTAEDLSALQASMRKYFEGLQLWPHVDSVLSNHNGAHQCTYKLKESAREQWAPAWDTTRLYATMGIDGQKNTEDLEKEILVAMLIATIPFTFPNFDELVSAVRIRHYVVKAGYKAALNFDTRAIERPADYWHYDEEEGFLLNKGQSIIDGLIKATQPTSSKDAYSFSCYRATEYVILLSIAQELKNVNPDLLKKLELRSERSAIRSGEFHEIFLKEYGTLDQPFPMKYYVPGDRVWFRNPDDRSSDISGYEGSWVIYLGHNLFTNFWKRDQPFSLETKCVEVYHWRDGAFVGDDGELHMDEEIVQSCVKQSLADPSKYQMIIDRMMCYRDPQGVYKDGGCIDASRESPRYVRPSTSDLNFSN
ncbi:MAG: hypothetical protein RL183_1351 [Pseudomonadota bacterium]